MKAVMYGAGNIGRGFIGMLFSASGYEVTFIDVAENLIDALNREKKYPVRIVSNEGFEDIEVEHISAVNGNHTGAAAEAIAEADIMATAVGVNILKYIVPNLAAGIRSRMEKGGGPLNIIICENLIDADKLLAKLIKAELTETEQLWFDKNIGLGLWMWLAPGTSLQGSFRLLVNCLCAFCLLCGWHWRSEVDQSCFLFCVWLPCASVYT